MQTVQNTIYMEFKKNIGEHICIKKKNIFA